jgi:peptide chain release factor 1
VRLKPKAEGAVDRRGGGRARPLAIDRARPGAIALDREDRMFRNLDEAQARLAELDTALLNPAVVGNPTRLKEVTRDRAHLVPVVETWAELDRARREIAEALEMADDPDMREMAWEEVNRLRAVVPELETRLRRSLIPPDPFEGREIILEVRAGTGGDEAALFAADLFRMYERYASTQGWRLEVMDRSEILVGGAAGKSALGYKEVICQITGGDAYKHLRHESGVHRVQRVPLTEAQGRIHTSAATVAIMPVAEAVEVDIQEKDLRIDVFRAGGPGGQSVNTTDSAVRITHLPTGTVVICQDEKSQHKNKAKAMKVLAARILEAKQAAADAAHAEQRRAQVGSGDRSERIRTYNYPQNRLTDHRIGLTLYSLDRVIEGELEPVVTALNDHLIESMVKELNFGLDD